MNRLAGRIDRADLETTARVLEELCRRLEADDAEDAHRGGGEGGNDANSARTHGAHRGS